MSFQKTCKAIQTSGANQNAKIQSASIEAIQYFLDAQAQGTECLYLSMLNEALTSIPRFNHKAWMAWLRSGLPNIRQEKNKNGVLIFVLPKGKDKGAMPAGEWFAHEAPKKAAAADKGATELHENLVTIGHGKKGYTREAALAAEMLAAYMVTPAFGVEFQKRMDIIKAATPEVQE